MELIEQRGRICSRERRRDNESPGLVVRRQQRVDLPDEFGVLPTDLRQKRPALRRRLRERLLQNLFDLLPPFRSHWMIWARFRWIPGVNDLI